MLSKKDGYELLSVTSLSMDKRPENLTGKVKEEDLGKLLKDYKLKRLSEIPGGVIAVYWKQNYVDGLILMYRKSELEAGVLSFVEQQVETRKKYEV